MKRVLYIGYLKEQSDWGFFATENILALEKAGYDVVCRSIDFNTTGRIDGRIAHLFSKDSGKDNFDVTFQHIFPNHMVKSDKFGKCVAITPNASIPWSTWQDGLELMDEVVELQNVQSFSPETYAKNYSGVSVPSMDAAFKFYTIASARSLPAILRCFHSEFDVDESVYLIIQKEQGGGVDYHSLITSVKKTIGLMPLESYKKDMVVDGYDTPESRYQLHTYCQAFLSENKLELDRNDTEASLMGNTVIMAQSTPDRIQGVKSQPIRNIGFYRRLTRKIQDVNIRRQSVERALFPDLNNARSFDLAVDEKCLATEMRKSFETWKENPIKFKDFAGSSEAVKLIQEDSIATFRKIIGE